MIMRKVARLFLSAVIALAAAAAMAVDGDDVDRIVVAIGVDSMHSVDEVPRMRQALADAFADIRAKDPNASVPAPNTPAFEVVVQQAVEGQQRMRRDPLVYAAYRKVLTRMLAPDELRQAAAFYSTPAGRRAHIAVIEAEKAAAVAMEEVAARQAK